MILSNEEQPSSGPSSTTEVRNGSQKAPDMSSGYKTALNSNRKWVVARGNGPLRRTCSAADLSPGLSSSPSPLPPPPSARQQLVMRGQTELSDLSSIGSTNGSGRASNQRGVLIADTEYERGREDEKSLHLDNTDCNQTPLRLDPDRDFTILVLASTSDKEIMYGIVCKDIPHFPAKLTHTMRKPEREM